MRLYKVMEERARLRGRAYGVGEDERPVDGVYEVSTISVDAQRETVAFKVSGVGPYQIADPYNVKTLTVSAVTGLFGRLV